MIFQYTFCILNFNVLSENILPFDNNYEIVILSKNFHIHSIRFVTIITIKYYIAERISTLIFSAFSISREEVVVMKYGVAVTIVQTGYITHLVSRNRSKRVQD